MAAVDAFAQRQDRGSVSRAQPLEPLDVSMLDLLLLQGQTVTLVARATATSVDLAVISGFIEER